MDPACDVSPLRGGSFLIDTAGSTGSSRRGLGSRLNEAGVDSKEIKSILRDRDMSTHDVVLRVSKSNAGAERLEETGTGGLEQVSY
jgi:hypothetical protein